MLGSPSYYLETHIWKIVLLLELNDASSDGMDEADSLQHSDHDNLLR